MPAWRASNHAALDGAGGLRASARWHSRGQPIVYCAPNPATALLEVLVHLEIDPEDVPTKFRLLKIDIPDDIGTETVRADDLMPEWENAPSATRRIGDAWLAKRRTAILQVPSVLVPETMNILINPRHPDSGGVRIVTIYEPPLDRRLVRVQ